MAVEMPGGQTPLTSAHASALRRRPTGAPPPLPREIGRTGHLLVALIIVGALMTLATIFLGSSTLIADRADARFLSWLAHYRTGWLTSLMRTLDGIDSKWPLRVLRWATILTLIALRRWRHLLVFLGA